METIVDALIKDDFTLSDDPWGLARAWMREAEGSEPRDPNAMALATVDADGLPDVRTVLLKGFDERGFVFYTNAESAKGQELAANPQGRPCVVLEVVEPPDSCPWFRDFCHGRRSRCLFR